jgi:hypothetical protein
MRVPAERALARESRDPGGHPLGRAASLPVARDTGTWLVPSEAHSRRSLQYPRITGRKL